MLFRIVMILGVAASCYFAGCTKRASREEGSQSGNPITALFQRATLSREEVLQRVRAAHQNQPIYFQINAVSMTGNPSLDLLLELANRNLVTCQEKKNDLTSQGGFYVNCTAGPKGELQPIPGLQDPTQLQFNAGAMTPREVTGITRQGDSSFQAIVRYDFEPTPAFQNNRSLWLQISPEFPEQIQSQSSTVQFQLFDDGWRLVR